MNWQAQQGKFGAECFLSGEFWEHNQEQELRFVVHGHVGVEYHERTQAPNNTYAYLVDQPPPGGSYWFEITRFSHFTELDAALNIYQQRWFDAKQKVMGGTTLRLSWWSARIIQQSLSQDELQLYDFPQGPPVVFSYASQQRGDIFYRTVHWEPLKSTYGEYEFSSSLSYLCQRYAASRNGEISNVRLHKLGTCAYKQEVMYTILLCMDADALPYPLLDDGGPVRLVQGRIFWRCWSSTQGTRPHRFRFWNHLSLAIHFPSGGLQLAHNVVCWPPLVPAPPTMELHVHAASSPRKTRLQTRFLNFVESQIALDSLPALFDEDGDFGFGQLAM